MDDNVFERTRRLNRIIDDRLAEMDVDRLADAVRELGRVLDVGGQLTSQLNVDGLADDLEQIRVAIVELRRHAAALSTATTTERRRSAIVAAEPVGAAVDELRSVVAKLNDVGAPELSGLVDAVRNVLSSEAVVGLTTAMMGVRRALIEAGNTADGVHVDRDHLTATLRDLDEAVRIERTTSAPVADATVVNMVNELNAEAARMLDQLTSGAHGVDAAVAAEEFRGLVDKLREDASPGEVVRALGASTSTMAAAAQILASTDDSLGQAITNRASVARFRRMAERAGRVALTMDVTQGDVADVTTALDQATDALDGASATLNQRITEAGDQLIRKAEAARTTNANTMDVIRAEDELGGIRLTGGHERLLSELRTIDAPFTNTDVLDAAIRQAGRANVYAAAHVGEVKDRGGATEGGKLGYVTRLADDESMAAGADLQVARQLSVVNVPGHRPTAGQVKIVRGVVAELGRHVENLARTINLAEAYGADERLTAGLRGLREELIDEMTALEHELDENRIGKVIDQAKSGLSTVMAVITGAASMMGLGGLLGISSTIGGAITGDYARFGRLHAEHALANAAAGVGVDRGASYQLLGEGRRLFDLTAGQVGYDEVHKLRNQLLRTVGGRYGASAASAAADADRMAGEMTSIGLANGLSAGDTASMLKVFYKDMDLDPTEAESIAVGIIRTAKACNTPIAVYVKMMVSLVDGLRSLGIHGDVVVGTMQALMESGMRAEDAASLVRSTASVKMRWTDQWTTGNPVIYGYLAGLGNNPWENILTVMLSHDSRGRVIKSRGEAMGKMLKARYGFVQSALGGASTAMYAEMVRQMMNDGYTRRDASQLVSMMIAGDDDRLGEVFIGVERRKEDDKRALEDAYAQAGDTFTHAGAQLSEVQNIMALKQRTMQDVAQIVDRDLTELFATFRTMFDKIVGGFVDGMTTLMNYAKRVYELPLVRDAVHVAAANPVPAIIAGLAASSIIGAIGNVVVGAVGAVLRPALAALMAKVSATSVTGRTAAIALGVSAMIAAVTYASTAEASPTEVGVDEVTQGRSSANDGGGVLASLAEAIGAIVDLWRGEGALVTDLNLDESSAVGGPTLPMHTGAVTRPGQAPPTRVGDVMAVDRTSGVTGLDVGGPTVPNPEGDQLLATLPSPRNADAAVNIALGGSGALVGGLIGGLAGGPVGALVGATAGGVAGKLLADKARQYVRISSNERNVQRGRTEHWLEATAAYELNVLELIRSDDEQGRLFRAAFAENGVDLENLTAQQTAIVKLMFENLATARRNAAQTIRMTTKRLRTNAAFRGTVKVDGKDVALSTEVIEQLKKEADEQIRGSVEGYDPWYYRMVVLQKEINRLANKTDRTEEETRRMNELSGAFSYAQYKRGRTLTDEPFTAEDFYKEALANAELDAEAEREADGDKSAPVDFTDGKLPWERTPKAPTGPVNTAANADAVTRYAKANVERWQAWHEAKDNVEWMVGQRLADKTAEYVDEHPEIKDTAPVHQDLTPAPAGTGGGAYAAVPYKEWKDAIDRYAAEYGVDPRFLAAMLYVESSWNPNSVSDVGAVGLAQFMPETAESLGFTAQDMYDPIKAIQAEAMYTRQLQDELGTTDPRLIAAAYNAGPNAVKEYGGIPPYEETQNHVRKVMDAYGGNVSSDAPAWSPGQPTGQSGATPGAASKPMSMYDEAANADQRYAAMAKSMGYGDRIEGGLVNGMYVSSGAAIESVADIRAGLTPTRSWRTVAQREASVASRSATNRREATGKVPSADAAQRRATVEAKVDAVGQIVEDVEEKTPENDDNKALMHILGQLKPGRSLAELRERVSEVVENYSSSMEVVNRG